MFLGPNVTCEFGGPDATDTTGNATMSPMVSLFNLSMNPGCPMVTILVGQAVHDRETDHDLRFIDGVFHMEREREFDRFDRRRIQDGVAGALLNGYIGQVSVGSDDGFQNDF